MGNWLLSIVPSFQSNLVRRRLHRSLRRRLHGKAEPSSPFSIPRPISGHAHKVANLDSVHAPARPPLLCLFNMPKQNYPGVVVDGRPLRPEMGGREGGSRCADLFVATTLLSCTILRRSDAASVLFRVRGTHGIRGGE